MDGKRGSYRASTTERTGTTQKTEPTSPARAERMSTTPKVNRQRHWVKHWVWSSGSHFPPQDQRKVGNENLKPSFWRNLSVGLTTIDHSPKRTQDGDLDPRIGNVTTSPPTRVTYRERPGDHHLLNDWLGHLTTRGIQDRSLWDWWDTRSSSPLLPTRKRLVLLHLHDETRNVRGTRSHALWHEAHTRVRVSVTSQGTVRYVHV